MDGLEKVQNDNREVFTAQMEELEQKVRELSRADQSFGPVPGGPRKLYREKNIWSVGAL